MTPRLYLDEDINPRLAQILRERGLDAISARDAGMLGWDDDPQLARATEEGRAFLTFNFHDFERIAREWFSAGRVHAGIIISYRQYERDELGEATQAIEALTQVVTAEVMMNAVLVLDSFRAR